GGGETLVVISTDLSHYQDHISARLQDRNTSTAIKDLDFRQIREHDACGRNPLNGLLYLARAKGLTATCLDLATSGDTAGPRDRVVGFGAYTLRDSRHCCPILGTLPRHTQSPAELGFGDPAKPAADHGGAMESAFDFADDLGPVKIIHVHEPRMALRGILVVDNVATGPAIGGLRMAPDVSTAECFRLARAMTLKNAAAGLPHGGGKSVLFGDPKMPVARKEELIRAFTQALRGEDMYIFGPDMGTDERCMAWVRDEIGRAIGLPRVLGGIPLDEIGATGWGIAQAVAAALPYCGFDLAGAR